MGTSAWAPLTLGHWATGSCREEKLVGHLEYTALLLASLRLSAQLSPYSPLATSKARIFAGFLQHRVSVKGNWRENRERLCWVVSLLVLLNVLGTLRSWWMVTLGPP